MYSDFIKKLKIFVVVKSIALFFVKFRAIFGNDTKLIKKKRRTKKKKKRRRKSRKRKKKLHSTYKKTLRMIKKGMSVGKIASVRALQKQTIKGHVKKLRKAGKLGRNWKSKYTKKKKAKKNTRKKVKSSPKKQTKYKSKKRAQVKKKSKPKSIVTPLGKISCAGEWITVEGQVTKTRSVRTEKIKQVGLVKDDGGVVKFLSWSKSDKPELKYGKKYRLENVVTAANKKSLDIRYEIQINSRTKVTKINSKKPAIATKTPTKYNKAKQLGNETLRLSKKLLVENNTPKAGKIFAKDVRSQTNKMLVKIQEKNNATVGQLRTLRNWKKGLEKWKH